MNLAYLCHYINVDLRINPLNSNVTLKTPDFSYLLVPVLIIIMGFPCPLFLVSCPYFYDALRSPWVPLSFITDNSIHWTVHTFTQLPQATHLP